ncbi:MAG: DUF2199 domain-containing protein [Hyphomonadaceae bacterium]
MSSASPQNDPRWAALFGEGLACSCGERHVGLLDLTFITPSGWSGSTEYEPNEALRYDGDFLSPEYCVREGKYFGIRALLPLPVKDLSPPAAVLAVWASVDRADFEQLVADPRPERTDPPRNFPARLVSRIGGYPEMIGLMGHAFPQVDAPPLLVLSAPPPGAPTPPGAMVHPLITEHRKGATLDRLFEVYAANGHDMRGSA